MTALLLTPQCFSVTWQSFVVIQICLDQVNQDVFTWFSLLQWDLATYAGGTVCGMRTYHVCESYGLLFVTAFLLMSQTWGNLVLTGVVDNNHLWQYQVNQEDVYTWFSLLQWDLATCAGGRVVCVMRTYQVCESHGLLFVISFLLISLCRIPTPCSTTLHPRVWSTSISNLMRGVPTSCDHTQSYCGGDVAGQRWLELPISE